MIIKVVLVSVYLVHPLFLHLEPFSGAVVTAAVRSIALLDLVERANSIRLVGGYSSRIIVIVNLKKIGNQKNNNNAMSFVWNMPSYTTAQATPNCIKLLQQYPPVPLKLLAAVDYRKAFWCQYLRLQFRWKGVCQVPGCQGTVTGHSS